MTTKMMANIIGTAADQWPLAAPPAKMGSVLRIIRTGRLRWSAARRTAITAPATASETATTARTRPNAMTASARCQAHRQDCYVVHRRLQNRKLRFQLAKIGNLI